MLRRYDLIMRLARYATLGASAFVSDSSAAKIMRFARGQRVAIERVREGMETLDRSKPTVWLHAASLGEYGIARPIISAIKRQADCNVVITFFSPTGYEAVSRRKGDIDRVFYLPLDTRSNVNRFLDIVRPDCAVFMVSEYWHNYLHALKQRGIPSFLISAIIRDDGPFFKWYGSLYRNSIKSFSKVFTLDDNSIRNLRKLGIDNVSVNGDPLFDNVALVASTPWKDELIERFTGNEKVFLAGSIHHDRDLEMVTELANRHPDTRFIIVPHEINENILKDIEDKVKGRCVRYSQCDGQTDMSDTQVMIVDFVGALAYIYRYAAWAYVGGGFTPLLHSVIEPSVYGIPVSFGPKIHRKVTPTEMVRLGIGKVVHDTEELDLWFKRLKRDNARVQYIAKRAAKYVKQNTGATPRVVRHILDIICAKK
ncbi:3-deoxy-D-manno-octulosonic acid transferase [Muribaculaceae bacterium Isolate-110 (HZI)]|nr:3-deoxy-D-manno-octulosonic acid transferase [Muribaculaceae bacterium Isolate-110 (HZI)]